MIRRKFVKIAALSALCGAANKGFSAQSPECKIPFPIAINAGTLRDYKLTLEEQIDLYAQAQFDGAELWFGDVEDFIRRGGTPEQIKERLKKANLKLVNMLGFATWLADDKAERERGMKKIKEEIILANALGCKYIAATGMGFTKLNPSDIPDISAQYAQILAFGEKYNVTPLLELWGHRALHRLEDLMAIAIGAKHARANFLLDFYHIYRGGNSFESLMQINCATLPVIHIDDYPKVDDCTTLTDADRIFPGDGACNFDKILPMLYANNFRGMLSVELFNNTYTRTMTPLELLKTCRKKTLEVEISADIKIA